MECLVRVGILADTKNSTKISVRGTLIESINENKTYKFSHVTCNFFNDVRISTNLNTIVDSIEDELEVNCEKSNFHQENIKLCCPYVDAVKINSYFQCINIDCKRKVVPQGNETKVTCMNNSS